MLKVASKKTATVQPLISNRHKPSKEEELDAGLCGSKEGYSPMMIEIET